MVCGLWQVNSGEASGRHAVGLCLMLRFAPEGIQGLLAVPGPCVPEDTQREGHPPSPRAQVWAVLRPVPSGKVMVGGGGDCVTHYLSAVTLNKWERSCWNREDRAEVWSWEGVQQTQEVGGMGQERWGENGTEPARVRCGEPYKGSCLEVTLRAPPRLREAIPSLLPPPEL